MACRLYDARPLFEPMYVRSLTPLKPNFSGENSHIFIKNAFENVDCKMVDILPRSECINKVQQPWNIWWNQYSEFYILQFSK